MPKGTPARDLRAVPADAGFETVLLDTLRALSQNGYNEVNAAIVRSALGLGWLSESADESCLLATMSTTALKRPPAATCQWLADAAEEAAEWLGNTQDEAALRCLSVYEPQEPSAYVECDICSALYASLELAA